MAHVTASIAPMKRFVPSRSAAGQMIVAVGGSDPRGVLRAARLLAPQSPGGVLAISVVEPLPTYLGGGEIGGGFVPANYERDRSAALLDQLWEQIDNAVGMQPGWAVKVACGDAAHALAQIAFEVDAPLIVMGIGRHRRIDRFLGMETTLRTCHRARCPVLAVSGTFENPRNVIIATDFSPASARAAEAALPMLDSAATVTLLHVADGAHDDHLEARFARFENLLPFSPGMRVEHAIRAGDPVQELVTHAAESGVDLIVAGRRGLGSLQRMLSDSVTAGLLRGSTCSVLISPEPQYADIDRLQLLLTGTSAADHPNEWRVQLDNFTVRNHGRMCAVEVDDASIGAQSQSTGYAFLGATYDRHDRRAELMFGDPHGADAHFTRGIPGIASITVVADLYGKDLGLRIAHGDGQTLLTFVQ